MVSYPNHTVPVQVVQRLDCFSFLAQPRVLHVTEPVLVYFIKDMHILLQAMSCLMNSYPSLKQWNRSDNVPGSNNAHPEIYKA